MATVAAPAGDIAVGAAVLKKFGKSWYSGKVTELWEEKGEKLAHVVYEDGGAVTPSCGPPSSHLRHPHPLLSPDTYLPNTHAPGRHGAPLTDEEDMAVDDALPWLEKAKEKAEKGEKRSLTCFRETAPPDPGRCVHLCFLLMPMRLALLPTLDQAASEAPRTSR